MPRFVLSLFVAAAALVPTCTGVRNSAGNPWYHNFRVGGPYSTLSTSKAALTLPGVELYISPKDSFDFLPSAGYNKILEDLEQDLLEIGDSHNAVVRGSDEVLAEWAMALLYTKEELKSLPTLRKHSAPRPEESLVGQVLTVETADVLFRPEHAVLCHAVEQDAHLCHKLHSVMDVTQITVSPNGKPSDVWVACHYNEDGENGTICHVMNVGDFMFFPEDGEPVERVDQSIRGSN